jgi:glycosyltransferase involved in cell wall biosynthesis
MACLLKAPSSSGTGVLVLTTQERDNVIAQDPDVRGAIDALKGRWVIGLHHNWHDHDFKRDPLFDFSMAGEDDLTGDPVPLVTLDACNFVPPEFQPGGEPFWDLLYVARPVFFKGFDRFLEAVRELYDGGRTDRILCLCPMPPYEPDSAGTVMYDLEEIYEQRFTVEERRRFSLITMRFDYPFPLDLPTLAHFYRSARVFAHFAPDERRCRVAAYAWASGMPVVGTEAVGSLLPADLRRPSAFFEVGDATGYVERIVEAIDTPPDDATAAAAAYFSPESSQGSLRRQLDELFPGLGLADAQTYAAAGLDIRLGRHHGISTGPNRVQMSVAELARLMHDDEAAVADAMLRHDDPEIALAPQLSREPVGAAPERRRLLPWRRGR